MLLGNIPLTSDVITSPIEPKIPVDEVKKQLEQNIIALPNDNPSGNSETCELGLESWNSVLSTLITGALQSNNVGLHSEVVNLGRFVRQSGEKVRLTRDAISSLGDLISKISIGTQPVQININLAQMITGYVNNGVIQTMINSNVINKIIEAVPEAQAVIEEVMTTSPQALGMESNEKDTVTTKANIDGAGSLIVPAINTTTSAMISEAQDDLQTILDHNLLNLPIKTFPLVLESLKNNQSEVLTLKDGKVEVNMVDEDLTQYVDVNKSWYDQDYGAKLVRNELDIYMNVKFGTNDDDEDKNELMDAIMDTIPNLLLTKDNIHKVTKMLISYNITDIRFQTLSSKRLVQVNELFGIFSGISKAWSALTKITQRHPKITKALIGMGATAAGNIAQKITGIENSKITKLLNEGLGTILTSKYFMEPTMSVDQTTRDFKVLGGKVIGTVIPAFLRIGALHQRSEMVSSLQTQEELRRDYNSYIEMIPKIGESAKKYGLFDGLK